MEVENQSQSSSAEDFDTEESTYIIVKKGGSRQCDNDENIIHQDFEEEECTKTFVDVGKLIPITTHSVGIRNQDFHKEDLLSTYCLIKDKEFPTQPSSNEDHNYTELQSSDGMINQNFDAEESPIREELVPLQPPACSLDFKAKPNEQKLRRRIKVTNKQVKNLGVIIKRTDGLRVTKELASIIRERLRNHILNAIRNEVDSDKLNFHKSGLVDKGYFLVTSMNVQSRDWLLSCDLGYYDNVAIKLYRWNRVKSNRRLKVFYYNTHIKI
ncbi:jg450 [Pararge aegeria aegeria]|uniref:Jg450 protein n=1 Tax=Pararge aegeria aegeria TaxID=348720 RepID=A0A8S4QUK9_9NEOP|nr:jg450 [Pararge aegeria aegeria]